MASTVQTVAVAAATSGAVALAIEYAAKPRLEARKERILARVRVREVLRFRLAKLLTLSTMLNQDRFGTSAPPDARRQLIELQDETYDEFTAEIRQLRRALPELSATYPRTLFGLLASYTGIAEGVARSQRTRAEKAVLVGQGAGCFLDYLLGPWWYPLRRGRRYGEIQAFIRKCGEEKEPDGPMRPLSRR